MNEKLIRYMAAAKLTRMIMEPVLVPYDVTLPDGTFIAADTDMDSLDPEVLDSLEKYYEDNEG